MLYKGRYSYFYCFSVFVWTGENDSNTLRVDAYIFENGVKNLCFEIYPDTCGLGLNSSVKFITSSRRRLIDSPVRFLLCCICVLFSQIS